MDDETIKICPMAEVEAVKIRTKSLGQRPEAIKGGPNSNKVISPRRPETDKVGPKSKEAISPKRPETISVGPKSETIADPRQETTEGGPKSNETTAEPRQETTKGGPKSKETIAEHRQETKGGPKSKETSGKYKKIQTGPKSMEPVSQNFPESNKVGPKSMEPRAEYRPETIKVGSKSVDAISEASPEGIVAGPKERIVSELRPEPDEDEDAVDVFTHSSTGFPGAWTEDEIAELLIAWEDVLRASNKSGDMHGMIQEVLSKTLDREVKREDVVKQMGTLRTEYVTYKGLKKCGVKTVEGRCVPQMERILRKQRSRKYRRRRRASTTSTNVGEENAQDQSETIEQIPRNKRVRFQRQNLQRTLIAQQKSILESLQTILLKIEESHNHIVMLLGKLIALQMPAEHAVE